MAMLKDQLTSSVAGIILRQVKKEKGRLTEVSDLCRINRSEFNVRGLSKMKLHRLLRIVYALTLVTPYNDYRQMMDEVRNTISNYSDMYDFTLLDE